MLTMFHVHIYFVARAVLCAAVLLGCATATAQAARSEATGNSNANWQVQTITSRSTEGGQAVNLALAIRASKTVTPRHVLLFASTFTEPIVEAGRSTTTFASIAPWFSIGSALNELGVVLAFADAPSDSNKRHIQSRPSSELANDIRAAARQLASQYPGLPIHLAAFGAGSGSVLNAARSIKEIGKVVIASADLRIHRTTNWSDYSHPVLFLHAPSSQCDAAPYLEVDAIARKYNFALVQVGYGEPEAKPSCGRGSQHVFAGLNGIVAATVSQWLEGLAAPASIGYGTPQVAWREQLVQYSVPSLLGSNVLEMTVMYPDGPGPFPVAVFNHGDIEIDSAYMRYKQRLVDRIVAREFLYAGWAVAFPARRGVGLSEGNYPLKNFVRNDGDATYKARVHAEDILPAMRYLKELPLLDTNRLVIAGQSAGGYAAMHISSLNLQGVVGAINFSGGRSDNGKTEAPGYFNSTMVKGFAEFGAGTKNSQLWVFAENDSRYSANTIQESHKAFVNAGGKATLLMYPPQEADGHFVYHNPNLWRKGFRDYLAGLNAQ